MRKNCDLAVFIDVPMALAGKVNHQQLLSNSLDHLCTEKISVFLIFADGIEFFRSENGVLLTAGNTEGKLLPKYFIRALRLRPTSKNS